MYSLKHAFAAAYVYFWFKYDLGQKYHASQVRPDGFELMTFRSWQYSSCHSDAALTTRPPVMQLCIFACSCVLIYDQWAWSRAFNSHHCVIFYYYNKEYTEEERTGEPISEASWTTYSFSTYYTYKFKLFKVGVVTLVTSFSNLHTY